MPDAATLLAPMVFMTPCELSGKKVESGGSAEEEKRKELLLLLASCATSGSVGGRLDEAGYSTCLPWDSWRRRRRRRSWRSGGGRGTKSRQQFLPSPLGQTTGRNQKGLGSHCFVLETRGCGEHEGQRREGARKTMRIHRLGRLVPPALPLAESPLVCRVLSLSFCSLLFSSLLFSSLPFSSLLCSAVSSVFPVLFSVSVPPFLSLSLSVSLCLSCFQCVVHFQPE
jgi:hypothetical protein